MSGRMAPVVSSRPTPLTPELRTQFDALRAQYPAEMKTSLVLPLLHCLQAARGHVTEADAALVADYIGMPTMPVVEALPGCPVVGVFAQPAAAQMAGRTGDPVLHGS